jgi:dUTP pyrophosphatase
MVVAKYTRVNWNIVEELPITERGTGGFGSTGTTTNKVANS